MKILRRLLVLLIPALIIAAMLPFSAAAATTATAFKSDFSKTNAAGFVSGWQLSSGSCWKVATSAGYDAVHSSLSPAVVYENGGSSVSRMVAAIDLSEYTKISITFRIACDTTKVSSSNDLSVVVGNGSSSSSVWKLSSNPSGITTDLNNNPRSISGITKNLGADSSISFEATGSIQIFIDDVTVTGTKKTNSSSSSGSGSVISGTQTVVMPNPTHGTAQEKITATGTHFTGNIAWKGDTVGGAFQAGNDYVATVTLNAASGYTFASDVGVSVVVSNGGAKTSGEVSVISRTTSSVVFTVKYSVSHSPTTITGASASGITRNSASLALSYSGSYTVTSKGFYWGTDQTSLSHVETVDDTNTYVISGLTGGTTYYYRAYVSTEEGGEVLSSVKTFITLTGLSVNVTASAGGSVSPMGVNEVEGGSSLTLTVTPNDGYAINYVTVDGVDVVLDSNSFTFTNITADHTFYVAFKPVSVTDTSSKPDSSSGGGFLKVLIVILVVLLAAAILFLFAKPAGMPVGEALSNLCTNISRSISGKSSHR